MDSDTVRVRFAPSPTGYLHIGGARTVLFNWLLARNAGGTMVLRIEDTDRARNVSDSVAKILDDLRWLGLDWDEGPDVGGELGPYFQSERLDIYQKYCDQLLNSGHAYYALESPEELAALREAAQAEKRGFKYQRPDPLPTIDQGQQAKDAGKHVTVRLKMPDEDIVIDDRILGQVRMPREELEDFIIQKRDGWPTYHFACVVDDAMMKITHVLRGQEHLMNTPKHVAIQRALGFDTPQYAHLPIIFNMSGSKMSKRDKEKAIKKGLEPPEIEVRDFRVAGYLPEAVLNFISLLGWSPGDDREQLTLEDTTSLFSIDRVGKTNAKFDRDKLIAFNTDWAARLDAKRLLDAFKDFISASDSLLAPADDDTLAKILDVCRGFRTFRDVERKVSFLFVSDDDIQYDPKAVKKVLTKNDNVGYTMLERVATELERLSEWSPGSIASTIEKLCEREDVKLGAIAQPLRIALTGSTISPPIADTLAMLGQQAVLSRIRRLLSHRANVAGHTENR
jgi:glutamyl-tRNA synthetase